MSYQFIIGYAIIPINLKLCPTHNASQINSRHTTLNPTVSFTTRKRNSFIFEIAPDTQIFKDYFGRKLYKAIKNFYVFILQLHVTNKGMALLAWTTLVMVKFPVQLWSHRYRRCANPTAVRNRFSYSGIHSECWML